MKIQGLEHLADSPVLQLLFDVSKDWMAGVASSEDENDEERTMCILPKTIGRNSGFVINILTGNQATNRTFYAKVQGVSMDTVLIHHLLKSMKRGPKVFYVPMLQMSNRFYHGVVTEKVKDWSMVSTLTRAEKDELLGEKNKLISTTFLLTILIDLGRFGNIPNNRENWGFVDCADDTVPYPHLTLIDFSRGGPAKRTFENKKRFQNRWLECLSFLVERWQVSWDPYESDNDIDVLYIFCKCPTAILEQAELFPYLHSPQAFAELLQSACDATALWLHETIQRARYNPINIHSADLVPPVPTTPTVATTLMPFRCVFRPNTAGLASQFEECVQEYLTLVAEWNVSLQAMYAWFPFPSTGDRGTGDSSYHGRVRSESLAVNVCEGDVGEEIQYTQRFADPLPDTTIDASVIDACDASSTTEGPSMVTKLCAEDVKVSKCGCIEITGGAPMYEVRISCNIKSFRNRSLSMEVNFCLGDVGATTEKNAMFSDSVPASFVPGYDYVGKIKINTNGRRDGDASGTAAMQIPTTVSAILPTTHSSENPGGPINGNAVDTGLVMKTDVHVVASGGGTLPTGKRRRNRSNAWRRRQRRRRKRASKLRVVD